MQTKNKKHIKDYGRDKVINLKHKQMNRIKNDRIQNFLQHIKLICDNILTNLFTLGNDLNTQTIMSVAYSPLNDIVYIYCADTDTGHILKQEIKRKFIEGEVKIHKINTDIVNNRYII